jgi:hypothetical protein
MKRAIAMIAVAGLAGIFGCGRETPDQPDGKGTIVVTVIDTSGFFPGSVGGDSFAVDSVHVSVESRTNIFTAATITGQDGVAAFERLPTGDYSVFVRREVSVGPNRKVFTGVADVPVRGDAEVSDTILVSTVSVSNLMINEILFAGSCASTFYFYDQFVELYNASADTLYLDGIILTRNRGYDPEKYPNPETVDYVTGIYAFQFPGTPVTGRQYPIAPGKFLVIAADAVDHTQWCSNAVDLSHADWETFNPLGNDYDNPSVPNLVNAIPGRTIDYLISLGHNGAVIATGEEYTIDELNYMRIPISNVIDGVEWSPNPSLRKEITVRVDAGFAGIGVVKYSGQSTERREPGMDSNNSTFDFTTIEHATPGFFHAQRNRMSLWR